MTTIKISQYVTFVALVWIACVSLFLFWVLPDTLLRFGMITFLSGFALVAVCRIKLSPVVEDLNVETAELSQNDVSPIPTGV